MDEETLQERDAMRTAALDFYDHDPDDRFLPDPPLDDYEMAVVKAWWEVAEWSYIRLPQDCLADEHYADVHKQWVLCVHPERIPTKNPAWQAAFGCEHCMIALVAMLEGGEPEFRAALLEHSHFDQITIGIEALPDSLVRTALLLRLEKVSLEREVVEHG